MFGLGREGVVSRPSCALHLDWIHFVWFFGEKIAFRWIVDRGWSMSICVVQDGLERFRALMKGESHCLYRPGPPWKSLAFNPERGAYSA
jgi:hypothetical protein